jgi:hypothetical protein
MAWTPGELLLTLHQERQFRLNSYLARETPIGGFATLSDAISIDLDLAHEFPTTWHLEHMQPGDNGVTAAALRRLEDTENGVYP